MFVDEVVQSVTAKVVLHFAEDRFDRVKGRRIANVVYWQNVQLSVSRLDYLRLVYAKAVHKQG